MRLRRPTAAPLVALSLAATLAGCPSSQEQAERARGDAVEALQRGERNQALAAIESLRKSQPDTPEALLELAGLLMAAGESLDTLWLLQDGIERFPDRDDLRLALAGSALQVSNATLARRVAAEIEEDSEHHPAGLVVLARAELELGNLDDALAMLEQAEARYPDRPEAALFRITTLVTERRYEEAERALAEVRGRLEPAIPEEIDTTQARALQGLRRIEIQLYNRQASSGNDPAALERLLALVEEDPSDGIAWQAAIQGMTRAGRGAEALERLEAAVDDDPERLVLYGPLASLYSRQGRVDDAEALLEQLALHSKSASAYLVLASFQSRRGDEEAAFATYATALAEITDEPELHRYHAEALLSFDRVDEARAAATHYWNAEPDTPLGEYLRARLDLAEGDADAAKRRLETVLPLLDQAATQFWLGAALEATGDREGARRRYGLAQVRDRSDPAPAFALMRLAEARGDWKEVFNQSRMILAGAPGSYEAWAALIIALTELGQSADAEQAADQALNVLPERTELHTLRARTLSAQGRVDEALAALDAAGTEDPAIEAQRVLALGIAGRIDAGLERSDAALAIHPESAELHAARAALLFQQGRADEGSSETDHALRLDPDDPRPLRTRCQFRAATGRLDAALADCEAYLETHPDDPGVHFMLGAVLAGASRIEAAIAAYRRAAELDPDAFAPRNNLAELLAQEGVLEGALAVAQDAFAIDGENPYVLDTLGFLYLKKGLAERAVSLLEDAHRGAPQIPEVGIHLAMAYGEAGRGDEARRLLGALESRSDTSEAQRAQINEARDSLPEPR
jgi:tetratricopeptide (TPR) repeat protein